ncbi:MAG: efflux RND transporter permease subunit [Clostridia bacterium]|nr:efflux RND transporter permease subunit [Clostridia bacterium]
MPKFSVQKPYTVFVAVIVIIILGVVSFLNMTPDLLPSMEMPYVIVVTTDPGAAPEEVAEEVTKPLEQKLATLDNIKNIVSNSSSNVSMVIMEFESDVNMDTVTVDINSDIEQVKARFDEGISSPMVIKMNPNMIPVDVAAVSYDGKDRQELSDFLNETLLNELEGTTGVAALNTSGIIESGLHVMLDQDKIDEVNDKLLAKVNSELAKASKKIRDGEKALAKAKSELKKGKDALEKTKGKTYDQLADAKTKLAVALSQLQAIDEQIASVKDQISAMEKKIAYEGDNPDPQDLAILEQLKAGLKALESGKKQLQEAYKQAEAGSYTAIEKFTSGGIQLDNGLSEIEKNEATLKDAKKSLEESKKEAIEKADIGSYLTMDMVSNILKAQNFSMPAGYIEDGEDKYLVSVGDEMTSKKEVENLVLFNNDATGDIRLKDVANIFVSDNSDETYANINGNDGILLTFSKQSNYPTTEVANNVNEKFSALEEKYEGLHFTTMFNQGDYIYLIINAILESLLWGALFAIIILFLFLRDIKPTIITLLSIPISLIFAITLMYFSGISINMMSLSGLAVAVGMLVDNSVVVIENIYRLRREGVPPAKAAVAGAKQVAMAITASTLTTMCVFVPIVFVTGMVREMFEELALTMCFSLFASLFIALTLVPAMSSKMLRKDETIKHNATLDKLLEKYKNSITWALKHKAIVLGGALILLIASMGLSLAKGFIFIPNMTTPQMTGTISAGEDGTIEEIAEISDKAVDRIKSIDGVLDVGVMVSTGDGNALGNMSSLGGGKSELSASLYIVLDEDADLSNEEIVDLVDEKCKDLDGEVNVISSQSITQFTSSMSAGVSLNVYGETGDDIEKAADQIGKALAKIDGIGEVDNGLSEMDKEYHFTVDKKKAGQKGLTVAQVFQAIYDKLSLSSESTSITWDDDNYNITVEKDDSKAITTEELLKTEIEVVGMDGEKKMVKVEDVASISNEKALSTINRYNQKQYLKVSAEVKDDYNVTLVTSDAEDALAQLDLPDGVSYEFNGENETIMDAMTKLLEMLLVGILLVYCVMVAQFQSLKSPFIIMFAIPLAITGGLIGLLITGQEISALAMVGFIMLVGIIVNNGIVLVDYINQNRAHGMSKREAIIDSGVTRLRPILMTTLTTVFGLVVMALGKTAGTDVIQPIAIVCIGGLLYATLLTLYVVPCIYDIMNKEEYKFVSDADVDITGLI